MTRELHRGRRTAAYEGDVVVFLIGFRVNKLWGVRSWLPVMLAMPPMLRELEQDPDSGLLGYRMLFGLREATLVQYWSSVDKLQGFANDPQRTHRPAWIRYFRSSYKDGATGIWHETYMVPAGSYETIYGNLPEIGLGAIAGVVPVAERGESAAARLQHPAAAR